MAKEMDSRSAVPGTNKSLPLALLEERLGSFTMSRVKPTSQGEARVPSAAGKESEIPSLVVVLFGWLNAQDKNLVKYAQLYHNIGYDSMVVLRHTAPVHHVFQHGQARLSSTAKELLELLDNNFPTAKYVIHYFSSGGCFIHWHILRALKKANATIPNLVATVFDSCPAAPTALTSARAMTATTTNTVLRNVAFASIWIGIQFWNTITFNRMEHRYLSALEEDMLPAPSLYIYSADDPITDAKLVDRLIETRRKKRQGGDGMGGLPPSSSLGGIEAWRIESSPHVAHCVKYPVEYRDRISTFFASVLTVV